MKTDPAAFVNTHGLGNKMLRAAWAVAYLLLFRPTPYFMGRWRSFLLRCFGAKLEMARFHQSVRIWAPWRLEAGRFVYVDRHVHIYNTYGLRLADRIVISEGAVLCTPSHDHRRHDFPLIGSPIVVESDAWIAMQAFVHPGVTIGCGAVVGARAVVIRDVPAWTLVAGNPAKPVGERAVAGPGGAGNPTPDPRIPD